MNNSASTARSKRKRPFCATSLHLLTGAYHKRINCGKHHPNPGKKADYCKLHLWATGAKVKSSKVVICSICDASLCTGFCWRMFHDVHDLPNEKEVIRNQYCVEDPAQFLK